MKDDEFKHKIDALELLRKSAMERYTWRAAVEWKLCLALWAAIAAFSGAVLTGKETIPPKMSSVLFVFLAALAICALHWSWLCGLRRAQNLDNDISLFFRDRMMEASGIQFPPAIPEEINKLRQGNRSIWRHWNYRFQLFTTILLAVGAIATVWWAASRPEHEKKQLTESDIELTVGQNKLHYGIPDGKDIKIILDKDGGLDFQTTSLTTNNASKP